MIQKYSIFLLLTCFLINTDLQAQKMPVNEYFTVVKTSKGSIRGYLEQVTDSSISVINTNGEAIIPYQIIHKIALKNFKRKLIYSQDAESASQKSPPNETTNENHAGKVIATSIVLGEVAQSIAFSTNDEDTYRIAQAASIALPILGFIFKDSFSNIDKFKIRGSLENFRAIRPDLERYSVQFQIR